MSTLICGGAGYIGSHMVAFLVERGEEVVVLDTLEKGHREALLGGKFYEGNIHDRKVLDRVFTENNITAVIDFAAYSLVGESMDKPLMYFENNVAGTITLLDAMKDYGVKNIVFSSTAATYGEPEGVPINESDSTNPTNPYGESKLCVEKILKWCDKAYGIKYTILRYFNAAGAHVRGQIGEDHFPETHLIPLVLQVALGKRDKIMIFGDDYNTKDGTCVRDYIHVSDLALAHKLALDRLENGEESAIYNLGNGEGFTVKEVIEVARSITGHPIPAEIADRRPGDPAVLIASSKKAMKELGWEPRYNSLETIIKTAWKWHATHKDGYESNINYKETIQKIMNK